MATYTIPSKQNDVDKFKLYLNSIKNDLDPNKKNQLQDANTAKLAYNEWKDTWSISKDYFKRNKWINDISKAEQVLNKAEDDKKNKIESWVTDLDELNSWANKWWDVTYNNESAYQKWMTDATKQYENLLKTQAEQLNINNTALQKNKEEALNKIFDPLKEEYSKNTEQFTKVLDQAMEQNKISIANQRKIADSFKEAAWVEALIAWSKVWPWMSESQIMSLWKDISQWYQKAIAGAEWNYELARINWWNTLKTLWMDGKAAKDALLMVSERLWLAAAEPYLMALASNNDNLNDITKKLTELKTGTAVKQYWDAEQKKITSDAYIQREAEWNSADENKKRMIINTSTPAWVTISSDIQDKIIKWDINWSNLFTQMDWIAKQAEAKVSNVQQQIATGKKTSEVWNKEIADIYNLSQAQMNVLAKWNSNLWNIDIWEVKNPVNITSQNKLDKLTWEVNTTKEDKVIQTAQTNVNNSYDKYIAWLNTNNKTILDKIKTLPPDKKTEAINKINSWPYKPEQKKALIYYINK